MKTFVQSALWVLLLLLWATPAGAGDPCPISFRITDLGPLPWSKAKSVKKDPVLESLIKHAAKQECTVLTSRRAEAEIHLGKGEWAPYLDVATLQSLLVDQKKAFRCEDAHVALAALKALVEPKMAYTGEVFYQRGKRRILLVSPGWGTACAPLTELQDKQKGPALIKAMWEKVSKGFSNYRHANP